jgi:spermidine/putrescine transport system ATP-binding protein
MQGLIVKNVWKDYEGVPLLQGMALEIHPGETYALLGRSGSGKSTLLRIIAGLETADRGNIYWNGMDQNEIPVHKRNFGFMFQDYALFPHLSVGENVAFGLRQIGFPKSEIHQQVLVSLEQVNLPGFENRRVTDLSGGEQQRVALARALAPHPHLLLLDEPLAALDRSLRLELQQELREVLHRFETPALYVTHDQEEAVALGDKMGILLDGKIAQVGTPEEVFSAPKDIRIAEFLGMKNFLDGVITSIYPFVVSTPMGDFSVGQSGREDSHPGNKVTLLLKPINSQIAQKGQNENILDGTVKEVDFRGQFYKVIIEDLHSKQFEFMFSEPMSVGERVRLHIPAPSILAL